MEFARIGIGEQHVVIFGSFFRYVVRVHNVALSAAESHIELCRIGVRGHREHNHKDDYYRHDWQNDDAKLFIAHFHVSFAPYLDFAPFRRLQDNYKTEKNFFNTFNANLDFKA